MLIYDIIYIFLFYYYYYLLLFWHLIFLNSVKNIIYIWRNSDKPLLIGIFFFLMFFEKCIIFWIRYYI